MNRIAYLAVAAGLAAGCATDGGDDYPINPQDDFTVGTGGSRQLFGRVCVASDLRDPASCSSASAGGLGVQLGAVSTTTSADGTFSVPATAMTPGASFTVTSTGAGTGGLTVVPTTSMLPASAVSTGAVVVPAIDADLFARMLSSNGILLDQGTGSILTSVTRNGVPVSGLTVSSVPTSAFGPFYDASSPVTWGLGGTATRGMMWIPGLTAGSVDLSFENALGGTESTIAGVQVRNGGVTVLDTALPGTPTL